MRIKVSLVFDPGYWDDYGYAYLRRGRHSWLFRFGPLFIAGWNK